MLEKTLKKLKLVQLEGSPEEIYNSLWYQSQPDGPVYFRDWFCEKPLFRGIIMSIRTMALFLLHDASIFYWNKIG